MVHSGGGRHALATGDHARQRGRTLSCDTDHTRPPIGATGRECKPTPQSTEFGQDLLGIELEKTCLLRPDLVDPDVCITCLGCLRDCRNVTCGIGTADNRLRDLLLSDGAGSLRKM